MQDSVSASEGYQRLYNKEWVLVRRNPCIGCLGFRFDSNNYRSSPSSRDFCSQNWVLDRRWRGYSIESFSESSGFVMLVSC